MWFLLHYCLTGVEPRKFLVQTQLTMKHKYPTAYQTNPFKYLTDSLRSIWNVQTLNWIDYLLLPTFSSILHDPGFLHQDLALPPSSYKSTCQLCLFPFHFHQYPVNDPVLYNVSLSLHSLSHFILINDANSSLCCESCCPTIYYLHYSQNDLSKAQIWPLVLPCLKFLTSSKLF